MNRWVAITRTSFTTDLRSRSFVKFDSGAVASGSATNDEAFEALAG